jgi:hypothetical protein
LEPSALAGTSIAGHIFFGVKAAAAIFAAIVAAYTFTAARFAFDVRHA